jgi:xanthine dehydrogenase molybdenum-binding subunit
MDPCELRLKNLVYPMDVDLTGAPGLGNAQIRKCVEKGMEEFNWKLRRESVKLKNSARYRYGTGMACGVHGNGYKGAYPDFTNVEIMLYVDGSIVVKISIHEQGCGTITTLQQIAAEALKADISKVRILEADTLSTPYDSAGTQASRVTFVCGGAVKKAGEKLLRKIKKACKVLYQWENSSMEIKNGLITSGGITKTFGEVALDYEKRCSKALCIFEEYESPANPASYAVSFVEVRVDTCTGQVDVLDCLAVHDIGRAVNRMLAEGQIEGGAHMSIGMALYENIDIDECGVVKSRNFSKYHLLNAPDTPVIRTLLIEEKEPKGPYGAKSVGEIAAVTPAPAILNAINDALGTSLSHYPVTPEDIVQVLQV